MSMNVPINKGNYDMDTEERLQKFEENRGLGWEQEYKEYRKHWVEYPEQQIVGEYPILVDIELSSICNLHCPMCFTITEFYKKMVKTQFMEMELFKKIIDEVAGKVPAIRLSSRGESTLHPQFVECIRYCKEKGIGEVSFVTNGSTLTKEYFEQIAMAGADWISISIDGLDEIYEKIRRPLKFKDTLQKIMDIAESKKEHGWKRPVIKIQSIYPAIKDDPEAYYNTFEPYVDLVSFNPIQDLENREDVSKIVYEEDYRCPQLYQRILVGADGRTMLCTCDEEYRQSFGDLHEKTIYEVWHSEELEYIRKLHREGRFREIDVCRSCYLARKTEETETFKIGDREIIVKDYVDSDHSLRIKQEEQS